MSTPYAITWIVDRYHVGTDPADIAADIAERCTRAGFTPTRTRALVRAALRHHEANRRLYRYVTSGRP